MRRFLSQLARGGLVTAAQGLTRLCDELTSFEELLIHKMTLL
jgi:hypothetical protein